LGIRRKKTLQLGFTAADVEAKRLSFSRERKDGV
jgi:hypothetical protein